MIRNIDRTTARKIDLESSDSVSIDLLITNKDKSTEHKTFNFTNKNFEENENDISRAIINDIFHVDAVSYNFEYVQDPIYDIKCPQNIVDRSIKFCKKYGADFLFAIAGIYGVVIYVKKRNKVKDFDRNICYRRYNKYFWKKYQIVWAIVEV